MYPEGSVELVSPCVAKLGTHSMKLHFSSRQPQNFFPVPVSESLAMFLQLHTRFATLSDVGFYEQQLDLVSGNGLFDAHIFRRGSFLRHDRNRN